MRVGGAVSSSAWGGTKRLLRIATVTGLVLGCWKLATVVFAIQPFVLPPPEAVFRAGVQNAGTLRGHLFVTLGEILLGFAIAAVLGLSIAVAMVTSRTLERLLYPMLVTSQAIPKIAMAPLLVIWLGFGMTPIITIIVIISFFPIAIASAAGMREVPPDLIMLGRSMGLRGPRLFGKIVFPFALGAIFAGLKMGMTLAVIGAIVGEFVAAQAGLGYFIIITTSAFNVAMTFAGVLTIVALGLTLFKMVEIAQRLAMPWRTQHETPLSATP
jgi:NitT/TauT family transport system permease protein